MNTEQDRAQMEAEYFAAEDDYFSAWRPCTAPMFRSLQKGFHDGWNERNKKVMELQARIDALEAEIADFLHAVKEPT